MEHTQPDAVGPVSAQYPTRKSIAGDINAALQRGPGHIVSSPIVGKALSVPQISRRPVIAAFSWLQNDPVTSQIGDRVNPNLGGRLALKAVAQVLDC